MKKLLFISCLAILSCNQITNASTKFCAEKDEQLANDYKKLWSYSSYSDEHNDDSDKFEKLQDYTNIFTQNLEETLNNNKSLACNWKKLQSEDSSISIKTSDDKRLRIFSWDKGTGGTLHEFDGLIQYVDNQKNIHVKSNNLIQAWGLEIKQMPISESKNSSPVYIIKDFARYSSKYHGQGVFLLQIQGETLAKPKLIKTKQGFTNSLGFSYDNFSIPDNVDANELIQIDPIKKTISIPVVIENDKYPEGEVTKRRIVYQYQNKFFRKVK